MDISNSELTDASHTIQYFEEDPSVTDVILVVDGKPLYVSKSVLIHASPVFRSMFTNQDEREITLPTKSFDSFVLFLRCIYPNEFIKLDEDVIANILPIAHHYSVSSVKDRCEEWVINQIQLTHSQPNSSGFGMTKTEGEFEFYMKCLYYGAKYGLHTLYKQVLDLVVLHEAVKYWDNEHYKSLGCEQKVELLEKKLKQRENGIFSGKENPQQPCFGSLQMSFAGQNPVSKSHSFGGPPSFGISGLNINKP